MFNRQYEKLFKPMLVSLVSLFAILFSASLSAEGLVGQPAPDFTLKSEGGGQSGTEIKLSDLKGKVVLVNFWASWCGPCRKEMPLLEEIHTEYQDFDVVVLGINVESELDKAMEFLQKTPVTFPILLDTSNQVTEMYQVDAMPTTYIIDRQGVVQVHHRGYKDGYAEVYKEDLEKLVRE